MALQKIVINCRSGRVETVNLTPDEEASRLQEIQEEQVRQRTGQTKSAKRELSQRLAELREMRSDNAFDQNDIKEKQAEIAKLKDHLASLQP